MTRRSAAVLVVCAAVFLSGALAASAAGPPASLASSLTANGRVIWNLDALVNDTYGDRVDCFDDHDVAIFAVARDGDCPSPQARYQEYVFTFLGARDSQFHLVSLAKPPFTGVTNVPLRVAGRYVACPGGEYHHGGEGWLVFGGGTGPNEYFWCN